MTTIKLQRFIAGLSILLFAAKMYAWYLTRSVTILTDALESTVNVIAGLIGLYSVILAAKPRDTNHPYGHGKAEFISAAVEGALIIIAALFITYEAGMHLLHPVEIQKLDVGIYLIGATGLANFFLGKYAIVTGKKNRSLTVESAGRHLLTDAYSTVAIVGGLIVVLNTKWAFLDAVVALIFAVIIFITGYKVLRKSLAGIMDEADVALLKQVVAILQENRKDSWIDLHNLRVMQYGEVLHIDAHMTLPYYFEVRAAEQEVEALEELIRSHFGAKVELFIHVVGCSFYQCKLCCVQNCPVRQDPLIAQIPWEIGNVMADQKHGRSRAE